MAPCGCVVGCYFFRFLLFFTETFFKFSLNRLATLNEEIAQKMSSQNEFDRAISETQAAYTRVMQSSQALLQSVHGATANLRVKESNLEQEASLKLPKFPKKVQIKGPN